MAKTPQMYVNSKLFPYGRKKNRLQKTELPDDAEEDLQPDEEDGIESLISVDEDTKKSFTSLATDLLKARPDKTGELEGKFKVSLGQMIKSLNKIVDAEYSQWLRYYHYSLILRNVKNPMSEEFEEHAEEELGHAGSIIQRILGLGGYPSASVMPPKPLSDPEEIVNELLIREQVGMKLYRDVLAMCGDNDGTRLLLEENMVMEQEHIDDLWRFLKNPGICKAGADQESAGRNTMLDEKTAKKRHENDLKRTPIGIGSSGAPDLPNVGRDWHGDATPDDESDDVPADAFKSGGSVGEAIKAFAGAPRFAEGPLVPPREQEFLLQYGYTPEEIKSGEAVVTPRIRAEFNRHITGVVQKSISGLGSFRRTR